MSAHSPAWLWIYRATSRRVSPSSRRRSTIARHRRPTIRPWTVRLDEDKDFATYLLSLAPSVVVKDRGIRTWAATGRGVPPPALVQDQDAPFWLLLNSRCRSP